MLIDTHCHLHHQVFKDKLDYILKEAQKAGIKKIISPGVDLESSKKNIDLAKKFKQVYAAVGIHPINVKTGSLHIEKQLIQLEDLIIKNRKIIVAIGETGLDFAPAPPGEKSRSKQLQIELFKKHIKLALKYKLPLIIHNRKASEEILTILNDLNSGDANTGNSGIEFFTNYQLSGVFHCFEGGKKLLNQILELNFYIGINGLVTYNTGIQQIVKKIPLDKILLETDAPFLIPEPLRSRKIFPNKPKNVKIVASWIAKLKGDSFFKVTKQTAKNSLKLFNIK